MNSIRLLLAALTATATTAFAQPQVIKLYSQPHATPNPMCDIHAVLTLDVDGRQGKADLSNRLDGSCQIFVEPNPRSYTLEAKSTSCGSTVYEDAAGKVRVTDHRLRSCRDLVQALVIVEEQSENGTVTLYSYDR